MDSRLQEAMPWQLPTHRRTARLEVISGLGFVTTRRPITERAGSSRLRKKRGSATKAGCRWMKSASRQGMLGSRIAPAGIRRLDQRRSLTRGRSRIGKTSNRKIGARVRPRARAPTHRRFPSSSTGGRTTGTADTGRQLHPAAARSGLHYPHRSAFLASPLGRAVRASLCAVSSADDSRVVRIPVCRDHQG